MMIGPHRMLCGDLTEGAVGRLMGDERADVVCTDPPWGPAHLKRFAGTSARPWAEFLGTLCDEIARYRKPNAPVLIQMGARWEADVVGALSAAGVRYIRTIQKTYSSERRPNVYVIAGVDVEADLPHPPHGPAVTLALLAACVSVGAAVLDPCMGFGSVARQVHALGGHFRGVELVQGRYDRACVSIRGRV